MFVPLLVTAPTTSPVSLVEAKAHLRVDDADENTLIEGLILAATAHLDGHVGILGRCLIDQTWSQEYTGFNACMRLRLFPVSAVTAITYTDSNGDVQTLSASQYEVLVDAIGAYVAIENIPSTNGRRVKIEYVAGYGDAAKVPAPIKQAILLHIASLYEIREREVVGVTLTETTSYTSLIAPYRRIKI